MKQRVTDIEARSRDKLNSAFRSGITPREQADILNEISWELRNVNTARAAVLAEEAYSVAAADNYYTGMMYGLRNMGIASYYSSDLENALLKLLDAYQLFDQSGDERGLASVLNWIGNVYLRMGSYTNALEYFSKSLSISENIGDDENTSSCLTNIGRVYYGLSDFPNALDHHLKSLELREQFDSAAGEATTFWDVGRTYYGMGDLNNAFDYTVKSFDIRREIGDKRGMGASLHVLGEIYQKRKEYAQALRQFLKALECVQQANERWGEAQTLMQIGSLYIEYGRPESSIEYLLKALHIAEEIKGMEIVYAAHGLLSEAFKKSGDIAQALEHFELYHRIKEEITGRQAEQTLKYLQRGFEIEKTKRETEIYRLKNVELADALEEVKRLNQHLAELNYDLEQLNQEKNEFLGIVAHDLKNPLAGIAIASSLIRLHHSKMAAGDIEKHALGIETTAERMKSIIANLLDVNAIETGKMHLEYKEFDIAELVNTVTTEYQEVAKRKNIRIFKEVHPSAIPLVGDRDAIQQILDNLISNAIKFSPLGKEIFVRLSENGYRVRLEVEDHGPGFTEDDMHKLFGKFSRLSARPSAGEDSTGLGLSIVKKLVEEMHGHVWCESKAGEGATFIVEFALRPE
jgi:signal transduction histidine kinase